jgi:hypothetical protein
MALAVELSRAVFMFQGAGIISENITSGNVLLAIEHSKIRLRDLLLPPTVTNNQRTEDHSLQEGNPSKSVTSFGRASTRLGILLLEVLLARDILPDDEIDDGFSYGGHPEILRALEEIRFEFVQSTSDAVRHCLGGIGCISNIQAQRKAFSEFVLLPLEHDLQCLEPERPGRNGEIILLSNWYHVTGASKDPAFPVTLAEDLSQILLPLNPGILAVLKGYLQKMQASCAEIAWLDEAISEQGTQKDLQSPWRNRWLIRPSTPIPKGTDTVRVADSVF